MTTGAANYLPDISDEGHRVVFNRSGDVWLIDTQLMTIMPITASGGGTLFEDPSISGDGNRVVYEMLTGPQEDLILYDISTSMGMQLTNTPDDPFANELAKLNGDGTRVVFRSSADLTGMDPGIVGSQLFLWDESVGISQLTGAGPFGVNDTAIDGSGTMLAFSSGADLDPMVDNSGAAASREVFLFNTTTGSIRQITDTLSPASSFQIDISADGSTLAFISTADLVGGNPDHSREVFLYDISSQSFVQITDDPEINSYPKLNGDGSQVVFYTEFSDYYQIFLYKVATSSLHAVTPADQDIYSYEPVINSDGTRIVFDSNADFAGMNADGNYEIFLAENCSLPGGDTDGDGVNDDLDECPGSDLAENVILGDCDSGLGNPIFPNGCSTADYVSALLDQCRDGSVNKGQFLSCFARETTRLRREGLLPATSHGPLQSCASRLEP